MKTHVFVVNDATFPSHLQHLFAGTGAGDKDFHINLLSDIKRVRAGDFVLFYIEATAGEKGGFYGIFKVANEKPLVFYTPGSSGWQPNLGKKLIYRTLIEPYEVYSEGVLEWEALDKLPVYATEIQWSLIYRKLKGKRGCTPILSWEAQRLMDMMRIMIQTWRSTSSRERGQQCPHRKRSPSWITAPSTPSSSPDG